MSKQRFQRLEEFWPYYVRQHSRPWTRRMHFIGNTNLIVWLCIAILRRNPLFIPVAIVSSYAMAWIGHFFIEHNIPATFRYPILSALADLVMYAKMWVDQMDGEVIKYTQDEES